MAPVERQRAPPGVAGVPVPGMLTVGQRPRQEAVAESLIDGVLEVEALALGAAGEGGDVLHADALVVGAPEADDRTAHRGELLQRRRTGVAAHARRAGEAVVADGGQVVALGG